MDGEAEPQSISSEKKGFNKIFLIFGAIVIVLLLAAGGVFLYSYMANSSSTGTNNTSTDESADESAQSQYIIKDNFVCAKEKTIKVTFNNSNDTVELILSGGKKETLSQVETERGVKYTNEDGSIVFWNQGVDAYFEEAGVKTYTECKSST